MKSCVVFFFFSSRRRHTRLQGDWSSDVCSSDLKALAAKGAQTQRLLWASTSTKNPKYRDVLYVEELIGADTVDTIPPATLDAFRDHGRLRPSVTENLGGAAESMAGHGHAGSSM